MYCFFLVELCIWSSTALFVSVPVLDCSALYLHCMALYCVLSCIASICTCIECYLRASWFLWCRIVFFTAALCTWFCIAVLVSVLVWHCSALYLYSLFLETVLPCIEGRVAFCNMELCIYLILNCTVYLCWSCIAALFTDALWDG